MFITIRAASFNLYTNTITISSWNTFIKEDLNIVLVVKCNAFMLILFIYMQYEYILNL